MTARMTATDVGRAAVYAAEIDAFEGTSAETLTDIASLRDLADRVTTAAWWPHGHIDIVAARSDASSSSARQHASGRVTVRLAAPQMTSATLLHELAHVLAGVERGHGPTFRRAHVDLVGFVLGDEAARWLIDAYESMTLAIGRRDWPPPPARPGGGAIAL